MAEPLAHAFLARLEAPLAARLRTARDLAAAVRAPEPAAWSAALPDLAALLPGGLPRGALVELAGRRSSGRTRIVLGLLAAATSSGENAALIDLGDALDPQLAADGGVVLERLLWARPRDLRETLAATEAIVAGGLPLVVADLGLPPVPGGRGAEAAWIRLARAARETGATLIVASPWPRCGVAATVALRLARARPRWLGAPGGPLLLDRLEPRLTLERVRGAFAAAPAAPTNKHTIHRAGPPAERSPRGRSVAGGGRSEDRATARTAGSSPRPGGRVIPATTVCGPAKHDASRAGPPAERCRRGRSEGGGRSEDRATARTAGSSPRPGGRVIPATTVCGPAKHDASRAGPPAERSPRGRSVAGGGPAEDSRHRTDRRKEPPPGWAGDFSVIGLRAGEPPHDGGPASLDATAP